RSRVQELIGLFGRYSPLSASAYSAVLSSADGATVDADDLAGDELGRRRRQPADNRGDVLGRAPTPQRSFTPDALLPLRGGPLAPRRPNPSRGQAVDAHRRRQR